MSGGGAKSAKDISVAETLELLDKDFSAVAKAFDDQQFALWVGSGISFLRAPNVGELIRLALEHLRTEITTNDAGDRFAVTLKSALKMAGLEEAAVAAIDYAAPVDAWPARDAIINELWGKYSRFLDLRVAGEDDDYLVWTAVNVRQEYGHLHDPDCEHLAIAILVLEGAVSKIASANWDGLIEVAIETVSATGRNGVLQVIVDPQDVRDPPGRAILVKFHGCAVLAAADPPAYRRFLTATKTQITDWPNKDDLKPLRAEVGQIATSRKAMMVGLSLQDTNLQDIFSKARQALPWTWPCAPDAPSHVFCEDALGDHQDDMLRVAYGGDFGQHAADIQQSALLRAFAKPALSALVLQVLIAKLEALLRRRVEPQLGPAGGDALRVGLFAARDVVAAVAPGADLQMAAFMKAFIRGWSRCIGLFRTGTPRAVADGTYEPISLLPLSQMVADPNVTNSGLGHFALAVSLLGLQISKGLTVDTDPAAGVEKGAVEAHGAWAGAKPAQVFIVEHAGVAVSLTDQGALAGDNIVVLHADDTWRRMGVDAGRRSPCGSSSSGNRVRHISLPQLLAESSTCTELEQRFLEEVTL
jgi:hypothetical protein